MKFQKLTEATDFGWAWRDLMQNEILKCLTIFLNKSWGSLDLFQYKQWLKLNQLVQVTTLGMEICHGIPLVFQVLSQPISTSRAKVYIYEMHWYLQLAWKGRCHHLLTVSGTVDFFLISETEHNLIAIVKALLLVWGFLYYVLLFFSKRTCSRRGFL